MSFDCHDSVCFRACDELRVELLRGGYERHVHHTSVFGTDGVCIETAVVDVVVQHFCFFFVDFLDCGNAAEVFKPFERQACNVNREAGGSVVKAVLFCLRRPFEHSRANGHRLIEKVFSDYYDGNARAGNILLRAGINHAELIYVVHFGQNVAGHIADERFDRREFSHAAAVNGVVAGAVDVIDIASERRVVKVRDIGEVFVFAGRRNPDVAVFLRFLVCLFRKVSGHDIIGAAFFQKVEGNCFELRRRAALHEKHVVVVGNVHKLAEKGDTFVVNGLVNLAAVRRLDNGNAAAFEIDEVFLCFKQNFLGKYAGTC